MTRVLHFFSRFGILQRALLMSILFVVILVTGFLYVISEVDTMHATADRVGSAAESVNEASGGVIATGQRLGISAGRVSDARQSLIQTIEGLGNSILTILAVATILTLLVGGGLAYSIIKPVRQLTQVIRAIEERSDLVKRIDYNRQDEIGDIARALNRMFEKFRTSLLQIATTGIVLEQTADDSSRANVLTQQTAEQLRCEADMVATATTQMAVTVRRGINETAGRKSSCYRQLVHVRPKVRAPMQRPVLAGALGGMLVWPALIRD